MIVIALISSIFAFVTYFYGTRKFKYWQNRGIRYEKPVPFFGNNFRVLFGIKSYTEILTEPYWKYPNEKAVGLFIEQRPMLVARDLDVIKRVLMADFIKFYSRGIIIQKDSIEPLLKNVFFADGDLWRLLRQRMTPAFSSGKLKAMFPLIVERAEKLQTRLLSSAEAQIPLDARDLMARYTTDFIGACGFGLDADSLNEEDSPFRKLGVKIFNPALREKIVFFLKRVFPSTFKHFTFLGNIEHEMNTIVSQIIKQRNYEPSERNDFIDILLECWKRGSMVGESMERRRPDGSPESVSIEFDETLFAAQVFIFFAAGFETSSSATSYTLHQLAFNPDEQKKVQDDVDRALARHNNKLCYDAVKEMTYLECAFKEAMRMFPSLGFLLRECVTRTEIPELGMSVDPGVLVAVPLQAIHNDPQHFPSPNDFRPKRFMDELAGNKFAYLPFGTGPRACIGQRMGLMQSLAGLAAVLSRFTVRPGPTTRRWPIVNPRGGLVQTVKNGLPLIFEERRLKLTS